MKVSLNWLKKYIPIIMSPESLADSLTMAGLEVEAVYDRFTRLDSVIVCHIENIVTHPNADKLYICEVNTGGETLSVVCGAPNVKEGMVAPLALPGTVMQDETVLNKTSIRGIKSYGMLYSEVELGVGTNKDEIMELDNNLSAGLSINDALDLSDTIFEISITPNRADCLSIIGIAREITAFSDEKLIYPDFEIANANINKRININELTSVKINEPNLCPRYAARLIENVKIAPSPSWLCDRLLSAGLKPINNVVDITNFVMLETGQPLHAFDFDFIAQSKVVVRTAVEKEAFTILDGKELTLSSDILMICDGEKPIAVAGIMGGLNSEIRDSTNRVFIESAYFDPVCIRKGSKKLGISSESSYRFERGVDPEGTIKTLNRAVMLMEKIAGGKIIEGLIDEHPVIDERKPIVLSLESTNRLLGTSFNKEEIKKRFESIDFKVEDDTKNPDSDRLVVLRPSFRVDILRPADLIEEVARLSGYNSIPATYPLLPEETLPLPKQLIIKDKIKQLIIGFGFSEIINYSFTHGQSCDRLNLTSDDKRRNQVKILNPLIEDQAVMRTSLIPGMLETAAKNISQQVKTLRFFETGRIFLNKEKDELPEENQILSALWTGLRAKPSWYAEEVDCDFYDIKGVTEELLKALYINKVKFFRLDDIMCSFTKKGHTAQIFVENIIVGIVGEVNSKVLKNYGLKQKVFVFEIDLNKLIPLVPDIVIAKSIPRFPAVTRDITIIVDKDVAVGDVFEIVEKDREELVEKALLLYVYEGKPIPLHKKSISFRISYRSSEKTLNDEMVSPVHQKIADKVIKEFNADLPA